MEAFLSLLASVLLLLGAVLGLIGAIGVVRLPDSYTRMHSASKAGALGAALILTGVAAHAMARAAHRAGITPHTGPLGDALADADGGDEGRGKMPLRS